MKASLHGACDEEQKNQSEQDQAFPDLLVQDLAQTGYDQA